MKIEFIQPFLNISPSPTLFYGFFLKNWWLSDVQRNFVFICFANCKMLGNFVVTLVTSREPPKVYTQSNVNSCICFAHFSHFYGHIIQFSKMFDKWFEQISFVFRNLGKWRRVPSDVMQFNSILRKSFWMGNRKLSVCVCVCDEPLILTFTFDCMNEERIDSIRYNAIEFHLLHGLFSIWCKAMNQIECDCFSGSVFGRSAHAFGWWS